uniref:Ig-like domain-containing protein n=1 Tax=Oryctolagus cuniculus TaxID=9986 RepID=U3KM10_RABIT|nr:SLAM family member 9 isoform X1 [Oryctolagus cuniculus]
MDSLGGGCSFPIQILVLRASLLLGFQAVKDPSSSCTLNSTMGGSAQLPLNSSLGPAIREIEWTWYCGDMQRLLLVSWKPGSPNPEWYELEDKYKRRFSLTELAFLSITNLTMEMSGLYTAEVKFRSGQSKQEAFRLCVYEPVPHPQILIHSSSNTSGWCNVTLECGTPGAREDLTVTWMSKDSYVELEQRGTLGSAPNSRNLSLSLPINQLNGHGTCVVSNPVDQKNAVLDLSSICQWHGSLPIEWLWKVILILVLMVSMGTGAWVWRRRKMETERAAAARALPTGGQANLQTSALDFVYAEINLLSPPKGDTEEGGCHAQSPEFAPEAHTIYKELHLNPGPTGDT